MQYDIAISRGTLCITSTLKFPVHHSIKYVIVVGLHTSYILYLVTFLIQVTSLKCKIYILSEIKYFIYLLFKYIELIV